MYKIYALLITIIVIMGLYIAYNTIQTKEVIEEVPEVIEEISLIDGGFSMDFPGNWGEMIEKDVLSEHPAKDKIDSSTLFSSKDDSKRFIRINIISEENNSHWTITDLPQRFITESDGMHYYYTGGGDNANKPGMGGEYLVIQEEIDEIIKTFRLK